MPDSITDICAKILNSISEDGEISAYVLAKWGKSLSLFLGLDAENLPPKIKLPWCATIPKTFGMNDTNDSYSNSITIGISVEDPGVDSLPKFDKLRGYEKLQGLCLLVQRRIAEILCGNILNLSRIGIDTSFPFFCGSWSFEVCTETE